MKEISIVIPCHNEEDNIDRLISELDDNLKNLDYRFEYVFVNDGSKDKTLEKLIKVSEKDYRVKVVDFSRNFGKEAAILAGLDYCSGDAAVIIDADLQMPVKYIIDLIDLWSQGNKLVLTYKSNRNKKLKSKLASKYYDFYNGISEAPILKDALDFQIMDREVVNVICSIRERARFFKGITGFIGYDYKVIPVEIAQREHGESDFSGIKGLFSYAFKSFAIHSDAPLKMALKIGIFISGIAFVYMIYIFARTLINGIDVDGYASTIIIMLFMFGLILLILGIMGYYIGLIYNEVKQRPNYIVDEVMNIDKKGE